MPADVRIAADAIAQYRRDGAVLIKGALPENEVALLERGLEESYANPSKRFSRAKSPEGEGETFLETFPSLNSGSLRQLLDLGTIPMIAARLMQTQSAQLLLSQIFYKKAGHINPTPWHQDTPFLRVRGDDMARVWLSCDPSPRELTLKMIRGSHRWNVVYAASAPGEEQIRQTGEGKMFNTDVAADTRPTLPDIDAYSDSFDILGWDVEPGDALVFNGNMIHAAGGLKNSPNSRRVYATLWGGPDVRYVKPPGSAIPTLADINGFNVPQGDRIGDHKDAFPVGWLECVA